LEDIEKKNKWINQKVHKKFNSKIQHTSKYRMNQRKARKKSKIQRSREIVHKDMAFDINDFIKNKLNQNENDQDINGDSDDTFDAFIRSRDQEYDYFYSDEYDCFDFDTDINDYIENQSEQNDNDEPFDPFDAFEDGDLNIEYYDCNPDDATSQLEYYCYSHHEYGYSNDGKCVCDCWSCRDSRCKYYYNADDNYHYDYGDCCCCCDDDWDWGYENIIEDESDTFNCILIRQEDKHLSQKISKKYKNAHRQNAYHPKSTIYRQGKKYNKKWCKQCQIKDSKHGTKRGLKRSKRAHLRACKCIYPNKNKKGRNINKKETRNKYDYQELYDAFSDIEKEEDNDDPDLEEHIRNSLNEDQLEKVSQHNQLNKIDEIDFVPCHLFVNGDGSGYIKFDELDIAYKKYWNKTLNLSAFVIKNYWRQWIYNKNKSSYEYFIKKTSRNYISFRNLINMSPLNKSYYILFRKNMSGEYRQVPFFVPFDITPCVCDIKWNEMEIILSGYVRNYVNGWNEYIPQGIAYTMWRYCL